MTYPQESQELIALLETDQIEWKDFARAEHEADDKTSLDTERAALHQRVQLRAERMLEILDTIGEPTLSNIGADAAQAVSILALHCSSRDILSRVLKAFQTCYGQTPENTYTKAIPSMTDWTLLLERKPQRYGTIWLIDSSNNDRFLPTVEDFKHVNERRKEYNIEPLRWPKSLAIPESEQPWLQRPLSELVMRDPTDAEYHEFADEYLS